MPDITMVQLGCEKLKCMLTN